MKKERKRDYRQVPILLQAKIVLYLAFFLLKTVFGMNIVLFGRVANLSIFVFCCH